MLRNHDPNNQIQTFLHFSTKTSVKNYVNKMGLQILLHDGKNCEIFSVELVKKKEG